MCHWDTICPTKTSVKCVSTSVGRSPSVCSVEPSLGSLQVVPQIHCKLRAWVRRVTEKVVADFEEVSTATIKILEQLHKSGQTIVTDEFLGPEDPLDLRVEVPSFSSLQDCECKSREAESCVERPAGQSAQVRRDVVLAQKVFHCAMEAGDAVT